MNRIQALFDHKKDILSFYCTAGFPCLQDTIPIIEALQEAGADMIEIGIPFSDPLADGPVIQQSSTAALNNGMTIETLFRQLKTVRRTVTIPLLLMGYLNPILQFGIERFCREAASCGIDGFIIPDLPLEEYKKEWKVLTDALHLNMIFLVAPSTPPERIREIDSLGNGFIYLVTAAATTGQGLVFEEQAEAYFTRIHQMSLKNPLVAGFGIRSKEDYEKVCTYVQGVVIGSSLIAALQQGKAVDKTLIQDFVHAFRKEPAGSDALP